MKKTECSQNALKGIFGNIFRNACTRNFSQDEVLQRAKTLRNGKRFGNFEDFSVTCKGR